MERGKSKNRIKVLILLVLLLACVAASAYIFKLGRAAEDADLSAQNTDEAAVQTEENVDPAAVIFTASDYQADPNFDMPEQTLRELLKAVSEDGLTPDAALICGDYTNDAKLHDYQLSPEDSIAEIRSVLEEEAPSVKSDDVIFVQGNHDRLTESISESGLHEFDSYLVYVLNTENDFPWKQGVTPGCLKKVTEASEAMKDCLDSLIAQGETRPLIIAGHVPLHYTARTSSRHTTGDNLYSSLIFDVVNEAAADLDIIYLFGHNHSKGWDCYLGGSSVYKAPGDTILLPAFDETRVTTDEFTEKTLAFTYMNAGYTGYYMNCGPGEYSSDPDSQYRAADETLTCSVISIYNDRIEISRYDENGQHDMGSAGEANPYKGGIDNGLIGTEYYSKTIPGTAVIKREDNNNKKSTN